MYKAYRKSSEANIAIGVDGQGKRATCPDERKREVKSKSPQVCTREKVLRRAILAERAKWEEKRQLNEERELFCAVDSAKPSWIWLYTHYENRKMHFDFIGGELVIP